MNILILGDQEKAPYHPIGNVKDQLKDILADYGTVSITTDHQALVNDLKTVDVLITYSDRWNEPLLDEEREKLIDYIDRGGRVLVLHSGISIMTGETLEKAVGVRYDGHPKACRMNFDVMADHPITRGLSSFEVFEEPYRYKSLEGIPRKIFLVYHHEEKQWPSGWTSFYGKGKLVCLHPGHNLDVFSNISVQKLIQRSVEWLSDMIE